MSKHKTPVGGWLVAAMFTGMLAVSAVPAFAQLSAERRGLWMATSASESILAGRGFGRLTLVNGTLAYDSRNFEWRLALSDIKRISASKQLSDAIEIETVTGQVYFVGILDSQLTRMSPGKAVQAMQHAVRTTAAQAPARSAMVSAGGGSQ